MLAADLEQAFAAAPAQPRACAGPSTSAAAFIAPCAARAHSRGELDLDFEAAARWRVRRDRGVVGVGDGLNEGEAKPNTVSTASGLRAESFEGLKHPCEFPGTDEWAGVGDR
jgi:hypothetical protein